MALVFDNCVWYSTGQINDGVIVTNNQAISRVAKTFYNVISFYIVCVIVIWNVDVFRLSLNYMSGNHLGFLKHNFYVTSFGDSLTRHIVNLPRILRAKDNSRLNPVPPPVRSVVT